MSLESLFDEHMPRPDDYYTKIWENAIVVLDTNILLNLYRFSDNTRDKLFDALEGIKDQIWIPYWVGKEYVKNRPNVIGSQMKELSAPITGITDFLKLFESKRTHPHLADETKKQLLDIQQSIIEANAETSKLLSARLRQDDIMVRINKLLDENIGAEPTDAELSTLVVDGEKRVKSETPPGYGDYDKKKKDNPHNPYAPIGDYIIWDAMKKKAAADKKPVIFICDDEEKGDWILKQSGQTIGPFPALLKEFKTETGQEFHIYNSFQFMNYYQEQPGEVVDEAVLQELKEFTTPPVKLAMDPTDLFTMMEEPHFLIQENPNGYWWIFRGFNQRQMFISNGGFKDKTAVYRDIQRIQNAITHHSVLFKNAENNMLTMAIYDQNGVETCTCLLRAPDAGPLDKEYDIIYNFMKNGRIFETSF